MSSHPPVLADREVLELLADEPELLAIADAVAATQPPRRRRRRPRIVAFAAALLVVVAIVALVPQQGHDDPLLSNALAAIGPRPVVHAVIEARLPQNDVVDLGTGRRQPQTVSLEYWYDESQRRLRTVVRRGRVVVEEFLQTSSRSVSGGGPVQAAAGDPVLNPALAGFVTGYREALSSGEARIVARGELRQRKVTWMQFDAGATRQRVAVDAESSIPIWLTPLDRSGRPTPPSWDVRVVETVARVEANFAAPTQRAPRPVRGDVRDSRPASFAQAPRAVGWPVLWLGRTWRGLRVTSLELETVSRGFAPGSGRASERGRGVSIRYAAAGAGYVAISQARVPEPAYAYAEGALTFSRNPIPTAGSIEIADVGGRPGDRIRVMGQLRQQGVYVTIWASSRELCLAAARALRRISN